MAHSLRDPRYSECLYFKKLRCRRALSRTLLSEPRRTKILTSKVASCPGGSEVCGSTCWQVSSGLLHTLPVSRVKLATTHVPSVDNVPIKGISTLRDLL